MNFHKVVLAGVSAFGLGWGLQASEGRLVSTAYLRDLPFFEWTEESSFGSIDMTNIDHMDSMDTAENSNRESDDTSSPENLNGYELPFQENIQNLENAPRLTEKNNQHQSENEGKNLSKSDSAENVKEFLEENVSAYFDFFPNRVLKKEENGEIVRDFFDDFLSRLVLELNKLIDDK